MTTIQTEFDQALLDTIKALTVQVEGLKKDVDVLWASSKLTNDSLIRLMGLCMTLFPENNSPETKGAV